MITLEEIQQLVSKIAEVIDAPISKNLTFGISRDDGTPCIQIGQDSYYYVARDRNTIAFQKQTRDLDELMYWVFCGVTSEMAYDYALEHPINHVFSRRLKFSYQLKLLDRINKDWSRKRCQEIEEILLNYPYKDCKY